MNYIGGPLHQHTKPTNTAQQRQKQHFAKLQFEQHNGRQKQTEFFRPSFAEEIDAAEQRATEPRTTIRSVLSTRYDGQSPGDVRAALSHGRHDRHGFTADVEMGSDRSSSTNDGCETRISEVEDDNALLKRKRRFILSIDDWADLAISQPLQLENFGTGRENLAKRRYVQRSVKRRGARTTTAEQNARPYPATESSTQDASRTLSGRVLNKQPKESPIRVRIGSESTQSSHTQAVDTYTELSQERQTPSSTSMLLDNSTIYPRTPSPYERTRTTDHTNHSRNYTQAATRGDSSVSSPVGSDRQFIKSEHSPIILTPKPPSSSQQSQHPIVENSGDDQHEILSPQVDLEQQWYHFVCGDAPAEIRMTEAPRNTPTFDGDDAGVYSQPPSEPSTQMSHSQPSEYLSASESAAAVLKRLGSDDIEDPEYLYSESVPRPSWSSLT